MSRFRIGDKVRVVGLSSSEWHGNTGVVVKTIDRFGNDEAGGVQECAIQFDPATRRWFLASQLARTIPDNALRFFRAEARERWRDLSSEDVLTLNGTHKELILFLQNRYGLGLRRATKEADDFIAYVADRIETACEPPALSPLDIPA